MAQCVVVSADGSLAFTAAPMQSCQGYLLLTPQEVAALQSPFPPLSIADGSAISVAVIGLWGVAWLWRVIGNSVSSPSGESS